MSIPNRVGFHGKRVLLVVTPTQPHVGWSLIHAANELDLAAEVMDQQSAFRAPALVRRACWWLLQRRPARLGQFSRLVERRVLATRPDCVVTTGCAPLDARVLQSLRELGIRAVNYSTDDPWNSGLSGNWFRRALQGYDAVYSPRRANMGDFRQAGCSKVHFLPFAYDPRLHFPDPPAIGDNTFACDVMFVGGADADRLPWVQALVAAGLDVHLWGGYWAKHPELRAYSRGMTGSSETLRHVTAGARLVLCLVRRANRDGHAMRTFEVPAMGGCMLAEDTEEHREILGADGECAVFFRNQCEMVEKAKWLLGHPEERSRLARAAYLRITGGQNTYADRLRIMFGPSVNP